jgi:hypothetical protein
MSGHTRSFAGSSRRRFFWQAAGSTLPAWVCGAKNGYAAEVDTAAGRQRERKCYELRVEAAERERSLGSAVQTRACSHY